MKWPECILCLASVTDFTGQYRDPDGNQHHDLHPDCGAEIYALMAGFHPEERS